MIQSIEEKVRQRRSQMLVHSYLYYHLNESIIDDCTFDKWAKELAQIQKECYNIGFYDKEFENWDGSTGFHLPADSFIIGKARQLLNYEKKI